MFDLSLIEKKFKGRVPEPNGILARYAVLAPITVIDEKLHFIFEKRAPNMHRQPGEICFPGGRIEDHETHLETAIRETCEELGISSDKIKVFGEADFVITFYNTVIYPFVGFIDSKTLENISLSKNEVEKIFTVPAEFFKTPLTMNKIFLEMALPDDFPFELIPNGKDYKWGKPRDYDEHFYKYTDDVIWGLTARIVRNILEILEEN